jgi:4-alpha-glucanotransferase
MTRPFINDRIIERFFGIHAQYVRDTFLTRKSYGLYELNDTVSTQRAIYSHFEGHSDENSLWIRDGLLRLVANVLLIEDPRQPDMFHPRIGAFKEPVFEALTSEERDAFMRLYTNYFFQRHSVLWGDTGYRRLSAVFGNTRMLVCAEDLGMLPDCVEPVLDALRILTLEIQQMPKYSGQEFTHLDGNPVRSVATVSTHDMPPLRLWWQDHPEQAQRFFATMLQKQGRAPEQLPAPLAEEIIARHMYSPSMLCILSLQDLLSMDDGLRSKDLRQERINVPSDPYNHWQWRMHLTIEQLLEARKFNEKLKTMIVRSKRS